MKINKEKFEKLFQKIANDNQTTVEQVKAEMQLALDIAWNNNNNNDKIRDLFPNGKPTIEEFLLTLKGEISGDATY